MLIGFIRKQWSNILFAILILLLLIPQTGKPIRVFVSRLVAFSPSVESVEDRALLIDYNWTLYDLNDQETNLKDFKGQKILINLWATWCPTCVAEMPSMQALYNDYKDKAEFLFVTLDDDKTLQKFLTKGNYSIPIYKPISNPPKQLRSSSVPTTFLINEEGAVLIKKVGAANWNSEKVRALLD